jgi:hypothetical protein
MEKLLRESLLDADMNCRYWDEIMRRHIAWETKTRVWQMVLTSGTLTALVGSIQWPWVDWIARVVGLAATVLSIRLFVLSTQKPLEKLSKIKRVYLTRMVEYEILYTRLAQGESATVLQPQFESKLRSQEDVSAEEAFFPEDDPLLRKCHGDAVRTRTFPEIKK